MTHQPLTKAEREELGRLHAEAELNKNGDWEVECDEAFRVACMDKMFRLLADLDAAEADVVSMRNEGEEMAGQVMQRFAELEAQRDRAESELDAERRMRVEAEAAAKRAEEERDALKAKLAESMAQELLTRSRAEEAHAIVAAMSMRPDLCHKPDCEVQKLRAWAPGQKLPACDCGAWELQGRIEAMAIAAARGGAS